MRLIQRTPDRAHPHEEGAKDMLRRHWALLKAIFIIAVVSVFVFMIAFFIIGKSLKMLWGYQDGSLIVIPILLVSYYFARLAVKAILPVKY